MDHYREEEERLNQIGEHREHFLGEAMLNRVLKKYKLHRRKWEGHSRQSGHHMERQSGTDCLGN